MNKWMNEWMNERMNEWTNERMNKRKMNELLFSFALLLIIIYLGSNSCKNIYVGYRNNRLEYVPLGLHLTFS